MSTDASTDNSTSTNTENPTTSPVVAVPRRRSVASSRRAGPLVYVALGVITLLSFFPFYWILVSATRTNGEMNSTSPPLYPGGRLLANIAEAAGEANLVRAVLISTVVSLTVAAGTVLTSTMAGFALSHLRVRGARFWLAGIVGTMMVPLQLGVISLFQIMAKLGLVGNPTAVVLPFLASAFGVFFMRQYLLGALPVELVEAARVDGASSRRVFWTIVVPIAKPGMAVLGMLTVMTAWNEFFWPIIVLNADNPTVQVAISQLGQGYVSDRSVIMAGTLLCTLPVIVAFSLLGKQITGGILQGAVK